MRILTLLVVLMSVTTSVSHSTHVIRVADCVLDAAPLADRAAAT